MHACQGETFKWHIDKFKNLLFTQLNVIGDKYCTFSYVFLVWFHDALVDRLNENSQVSASGPFTHRVYAKIRFLNPSPSAAKTLNTTPLFV